ncbi:MAG: HDOD domain-containing protein [Aquabacterium sp.]
MHLAAMLRREEIMDQTGRLVGHRFSYRAQPLLDDGRPDHARAAAGYRAALEAAQASSQAGRRLAVISIDPAQWPHADFRSIKGAHTVFHVCLGDGEPITADSYVALKEMRATGAGLAVSGELPPDWAARIWPHATHAFVTYATDAMARFERAVQALRQTQPHLTLAAENVGSWPERRLCMSLGMQYALGDFLTSVEERASDDKISQSRIALTDMLNLVRRDGDTRALAEVAKRDPGISLHLLRTASSPGYGVMRPITSIDQAIMILGRNALYRWLAVSLFRTGHDSPRDEALLEVALARARFLELSAPSGSGRQLADELFLVGLLSFIDALLGMPMTKAVATMSLPSAVREVLLDNQGPYVPYLMLALAVEKCHATRAMQLAEQVGLTLERLNEHRDAALMWAEEAVHPAPSDVHAAPA